MNVRQLKSFVIVLMLVAALGGTYSLVNLTSIGESRAATAPALTASPSLPPPVGLPDMANIVDRNGPAVVNISVTGSASPTAGTQEIPQLDPDDPFYELFRHFRVPRQHGDMPIHGLGSGFIVTPDGIILTSAHVVEEASEVTVKLTDKREFKAKVRGLDKASDIAVLKIDAHDLPTARLGSSANTRVGEWVLAIGSPFGFENSASAGIVSAKSRSLPDGSYVPFIQTDVAVNPGNSGGPLINMAGEVIGINSQIYSRSGGYQGLSFAIPIEVAMSVEKQIITSGKVQRGRMGVAIQELSQSLAESFGLKKPAGALVSAVDKDGPAAKAGIEPGDVILAINGKEIGNSGELPAIVAGMSAGDTARLQIWRKGAAREVTVKIAAFTEEKVAAAETPESAKGRLGLAVRPLTPEEQRQADIDGGLLVQGVSGAAARAGLQPGDVIISVNGEKIRGAEQFRKLLAKAGKRVVVLVERGDARVFIPVNPG
ncbi:MAG: DegQ family serine endoprotease [Bacteroidota bacterium]